MANVLSDEKKQQVLALGRLGWSLRRIEQATGVRRETASIYLKTAGIAVRPAGGWGRQPALPGVAKRISEAGAVPSTDAGKGADPGRPKPATSQPSNSPSSKPAKEVTTDFGAGKEVFPASGVLLPQVPAGEGTAEPDTPKPASEVTPDPAPEPAPVSAIPPKRSPSASACEPYREIMEVALARGRNAMAIWQDLVSQCGFAGAYTSVKRFVHRLRGTRVREAHPVIVTAPGEEAQVDYGTGPMVRDPQSGKYRRTRLFVLTLGYSRKSVRLLVFQSSSRTWAELHEKAFRRLGGVVQLMVLDNLREGVLVPDIYDPTLNPLYRDMLAHYGVVAMPCRVQHPDRKGKVEAGVGHAQKTPLKGLRFESLEQAQAYLDRWETHWADTRIHGTTKRQVAAMFAEEKPTLRPLPLEPFRYYQYGQQVARSCFPMSAGFSLRSRLRWRDKARFDARPHGGAQPRGRGHWEA